jgi:putative nucleotidyltransferase with HDIG domain
MLKKIVPTINPELSYQEILSVSLKWILFICVTVGIPMVAIGTFEAVKLRQFNIASVYLCLFIPVFLTFLFRSRLSFQIAAWVLLISVFLFGTTNLIFYGFSGAGLPLFFTVYVLASLFFGLKGGLYAIGISLLAMTIIGLLMSLGTLSVSTDLTQLSRSPVSWLTASSILFGLGILIVSTIVFIQQHLLQIINLNNSQKRELIVANQKLHEDNMKIRKAEERLQEKVNELTCLYAINRDTHKNLSIEQLGRQTIRHLIPALPYPDQTIPLIEINGHRFTTTEFVEPVFPGLSAEIKNGDKNGKVQIFYKDQIRNYLPLETQDLLNSVAEIFSMAIERDQARQDTERHLRRLHTLREIDQTINHDTELWTSLNTIIGKLVKQLEVDAACLLLFHRDSKRLVFSVGAGFRTDAFKHTSLELGQSYAGMAALNRSQLYIPNIQERKTRFLRSPHFKQEEFITYFCVPLITKGKLVGVLEIFHRSHLEPDKEWVEFMNTLAGQAAIAIDSVNQFNAIQELNKNLRVAYDATIEGWARALEMRDMETEGHCRRVTDLTITLAERLKIASVGISNLRRGALLHDIGKMAIPDYILNKPGPLNEDEWHVMRQHPQFALDMLKNISFLETALDIPHYHHERWDGSGYPLGLSGKDIPVSARIFAIVDVYDALRSDRPYRPAWPLDRTLNYIQHQSGSHFDPDIVNEFIKIIEPMRQELK